MMDNQEQQPLSEGARHAVIVSELEKQLCRFVTRVKDLEDQLKKANLDKQRLAQECEDEKRKHGQCRVMLNKMFDKNDELRKKLEQLELQLCEERGADSECCNKVGGQHQESHQNREQCTDTAHQNEIPKSMGIDDTHAQGIQEEMVTEHTEEDVCGYKDRIRQLEIKNGLLKEENVLLRKQLTQPKQGEVACCRTLQEQIQPGDIFETKLQCFVKMLEASCSELESKLDGMPTTPMQETGQHTQSHVAPTFDRPSQVVREDTQPCLSKEDYWRFADVDKNNDFYYTVLPPPQLMKDHPWTQINSDIRRHSRHSLKKTEKRVVTATKSSPFT